LTPDKSLATAPYIYIYIYIYRDRSREGEGEREREGERDREREEEENPGGPKGNAYLREKHTHRTAAKSHLFILQPWWSCAAHFAAAVC